MAARDHYQSLVVLDDPPARLDRLPVGAPVVLPGAGRATRTRLADAGHEVVAAGELLSRELTDEAKAGTFEIMERIWNLQVDKITLSRGFIYRGIPLSGVAHSPLTTALADALGHVAALDARFGRDEPDAVFIAATPGPWGRAARELARARGIRIRRLSSEPPRKPLWPPTRRSVSQFVPDVLRRLRDARDAKRDTSVYTEVPEGFTTERREVEILALAYTLSQGRTLIPLVEELRSRGHSVELAIDAQGMAREACRRASFQPSALQTDADWSQAKERVEKALPRLAGLWRRFLGRSHGELSFRGVPVLRLMESEWRLLSDTSLHHASLRRYLWWTELLMKAIEDWSPKLVVVADEAMPFGALAVRAAAAAEVPSLCVIHGAIPDHPKHASAKATRVAVNGELTKRLLLSRGTEPERIAVTGLPQFDPLEDPGQFDPAPVFEELGVPRDLPVVVHTMLSGQGVTSMDEVIAATSEVVESARELGDKMSFIFKRHPADGNNLLVTRMGVDPEKIGVALTYDAPTFNLLAGADVVITQMSTTGQEAIMLGKPLVIVNLSGKPDTIPYVEYGAALGVYRPGELTDALRRALTDKDTRDALSEGRACFIKDFAHRADGKATERVVAVVEQLLAEGDGVD